MAVLRGKTLYSYRIRGFITLAGTPLPCEIKKIKYFYFTSLSSK